MVLTGVKANPENNPVSIITTIDGKDYICDVYIKAPAIAKASVKVKAGKTTTVSLKNTKIKKNEIEWKSEDEGIAAVSTGGKVKGISKGEVKIYTETGGVRNECMVYVN